jgi:hypothetical protein
MPNQESVESPYDTYARGSPTCELPSDNEETEACEALSNPEEIEPDADDNRAARVC